MRIARFTIPNGLVSIECILFGIGFFSRHHQASWYLVIGLAVLSLWLGYRNFCYYRTIADTPTTKIRSASQGYVELQGRGRPLAGEPVLSPLYGLPVLWYHYRVEERSGGGNNWQCCFEDESDASFIIEDETGCCWIDPVNAKMCIKRYDIEVRGDRRHHQWCLINNDPIYVLGYLTTLRSESFEVREKERIKATLDDWKKDQNALLKRFDLDGNGEIDFNEWQLARKQAQREVRQQIAQEEAQAMQDTNLIRAHSDIPLYLISDQKPQRLARRYALLAMAHFALFVAACVLATYLLEQQF